MSIKYTGTSTFFAHGHMETLPACHLSGTLESVTDVDALFQLWQVRQEGGEVLEFFLEKPSCPPEGLCGGGSPGKKFHTLPEVGTEIDAILFEYMGLSMFQERREETDMTHIPACERASWFSWSHAKQSFMQLHRNVCNEPSGQCTALGIASLLLPIVFLLCVVWAGIYIARKFPVYTAK